MREILFRGKRTDNGEWIEGQLAYFFDKKENPYIMPYCYFATREFNEEDEEGNEVISDEIAFGGFISVIPETVGQRFNCGSGYFYEGDIVAYYHPNPKTQPKEYVVKFNLSFVTIERNMVTHGENVAIIIDEDVAYIMTIIGNIHDKQEENVN